MRYNPPSWAISLRSFTQKKYQADAYMCVRILSSGWLAMSMPIIPSTTSVSCQCEAHFVIVVYLSATTGLPECRNCSRAFTKLPQVSLWPFHAVFWHSREQYLTRLASSKCRSDGRARSSTKEFLLAPAALFKLFSRKYRAALLAVAGQHRWCCSAFPGFRSRVVGATCGV